MSGPLRRAALAALASASLLVLSPQPNGEIRVAGRLAPSDLGVR